MKRLIPLLLLAIPIVAYAAGSSYFIPTIEMVLDASGDPATVSHDITFTGDVELSPNTTVPAGAIDHSELTNIGINDHHVPTVDTSATTLCSGLEVLRGDGTCALVEAEGGGGAIRLALRDDFTALANGITTDFFISTTPAQHDLMLVMDGIVQHYDVDYTLTDLTISFTTAPSADTGSLFAVYHSSIPVAAQTALDSHALNADAHHGNQSLMSVSVRDQTNAASYTVIQTFVFPGSTYSDGLSRVIFNAWKDSGGGACNFRIYDVTNALTILETLNITSVLTSNIFENNIVSNIPTSPAIFEVQAQRVGGGTTCRVEYLTMVWQ
jgi:hypothetical protein